jgi:hypothetical protein
MDRLTAWVVRAHLKLRIEMATPELIEEITNMAKPPGERIYIPRPIELAGMRSRLMRAKEQEKDLAEIGKDYDAVQDGIDEAKDVLKGHVGDLHSYHDDLRSTIASMLERSNGGPTDGESDGRQSSSEQSGAPERSGIAPPEEKQPEQPAEPAASWAKSA